MQRIFLIGYMGAGKTTLGKVLARQMNLSFIDTDIFIENRFHKTVSDIFATEGEKRFREIEHKIICELAEFEDVVISTGGGAPCFMNNMQTMNEAGTTVFLEVSVEELATRLEISKNQRPIIKGKTGPELRQFISENLEKRRPFYQQAKIIFDAEIMGTEHDTEVLAERLEEKLMKRS